MVGLNGPAVVVAEELQAAFYKSRNALDTGIWITL